MIWRKGLCICQMQAWPTYERVVFIDVLSAVSGGNQFHPHPLRFRFVKRFYSLFNLCILRRFCDTIIGELLLGSSAYCRNQQLLSGEWMSFSFERF